ncbi:MAG: YgdI/YgdR family lipoprotein [Planctomycetota bacterium]|jgi:hypothetical protein
MRCSKQRLPLWLPMLLILGAVSCTTPCVVLMEDGRRIHTADRPEVEDGTGFYIFEDVGTGKEVRVNKDHIIEIRVQ